MGLVELDHDGPGEVLPLSGAVTGLVELVGGLGIGVVVEELIEQGHGGRGGEQEGSGDCVKPLHRCCGFSRCGGAGEEEIQLTSL